MDEKKPRHPKTWTRLHPDVLKQLRREANRRSTSLASVINHAIVDWLERPASGQSEANGPQKPK